MKITTTRNTVPGWKVERIQEGSDYAITALKEIKHIRRYDVAKAAAIALADRLGPSCWVYTGGHHFCVMFKSPVSGQSAEVLCIVEDHTGDAMEWLERLTTWLREPQPQSIYFEKSE
ncbi:MAG: hypothetical protein JW713_06495 [Pontiellaceae bacterium]|nr:hypothetical protein [Pontiellaceae bacterium]